jgi:inorganic pyrophosphatase
VTFDGVHEIGDLPGAIVDQIEAFFAASAAGGGKVFHSQGRHGSKRARKLVMDSLRDSRA